MYQCAPHPADDAGAYDDWHRTMQVNVLAPMQLTSLLVPGMQKQKWGLIVNIGSVAGGEQPATVRPVGHCQPLRIASFQMPV